MLLFEKRHLGQVQSQEEEVYGLVRHLVLDLHIRIGPHCLDLVQEVYVLVLWLQLTYLQLSLERALNDVILSILFLRCAALLLVQCLVESVKEP